MGYYASASGNATIISGKKEELEVLLEDRYGRNGCDCSLDYDFDTKNVDYINLYDSEKYHEEDTVELLDLISPYITEGCIDYTGEDGEHWLFTFDPESKKWNKKDGMTVYNAEDICSFIRSDDMSAEDIDKIFRTLSEKKECIGGKIWTTWDIKNQIFDNYPVDLTGKDLEKIVFAGGSRLKDSLSDATDKEWSAVDQAIRDAGIIISLTDIEWDVNREDFDNEAEYRAVLENDLPESLEIPLSELEDYSSLENYLSDCFGYLVKGYNFEKDA